MIEAIAILTAAVLIFFTAFFCIFRTKNILRIIIAIEVMMKAVTLLFVFAGYINGNSSLPQTFIVTIILAEVIVAVVAAGIAINVYKKYGTLDIDIFKTAKDFHDGEVL